MRALKTIGLMGGMSWESTAMYYRYINAAVHERLGGEHSAEMVIHSVDFHELVQMQLEGRWEEVTEILPPLARKVEAGGADVLLLCCNTLHKVAAVIEESVNIPFIHIVDPAAEAMRGQGIERIGLMATAVLMGGTYFQDRLSERHGIETILPEPPEREEIHRVIVEELIRGRVEADSKRRLQEIVGGLQDKGAQGLFLACTELGMIIEDADVDLPVFESAALHAAAAVKFAFGD